MGDAIKYYPLTHPQKGIWYTEKMYPNTSIGNIAGTVRFKSEVDYPLLEKAINIYIEKNDGMRLRIVEKDGEPIQYISQYTQKQFDYYDFSSSTIEELYKWDEVQTRAPFKLIDSELFYFGLIKVNQNDGGFYIKLHHIISDAWTIVLAVNQIIEYYSRLKKDQEKEIYELPKKRSYLEYIQSEEDYKKSEKFKRDREYWQNLFETIPEPTNLKPNNATYANTKAKRKTFIIPTKLAKKLHEYCGQKKASVASLFLAGLSLYINRVTGKEDLVIGTMVLNRTDHKEKDTSGMFVSTAPIKMKLNDNEEFESFVQDLSRTWMGLLRHQKYPYDLLQKEIREKHNSTDNIYEVLISYQNAKFNKEEHKEDYDTRWHFNGYQTETLAIHINDREDMGDLIIDYDFQSDLFHTKEIEFIHDHILRILWHALDQPSKKISKLHMLSEKEYNKILYEFNNTLTEYPKDKLIHEIFENQVKKTPDDIAVYFENKTLTYRELNEKSNQLARTLVEKGVKPDNIIGLMVDRSLEMVIGIFGILKAGGAYLPIDPDYPETRLAYILEDAGANLLLTQNKYVGKLKFKGNIIDLDSQKTYSKDNNNLNTYNKSNNLAYVIYTSGSTGEPKGVIVEHGGVINLWNWFSNKYSLFENRNVINLTTFTFDVAVEEIIIPLLSGATVFIPQKETIIDKGAIIKFMNEHKINIAQFVPSLLREILPDSPKVKSLNVVISGGEALDPALNEKIISMGYNLYNHYGPTEITVDALTAKCCNGKVTLGKPISNCKSYILDKNLNPLPIGIAGELYISGDGLSRGYLNRPELTQEVFIPNPYDSGKKMYKTGDIARWYPQGDIEYLGRIDEQVKIRGHRVELKEIESCLSKYEKIKEVIVVDREDRNGKKYLCAYMVSDENIPSFNIKSYLSKHLPTYMIPSFFVSIEKIPLTNNGKVDRKALPEPNGKTKEKMDDILPLDETEKRLLEIWRGILGTSEISIYDNFFEIGGDSIGAIQLVAMLYKDGIEIKIQDIYKYPTIKEQGEIIKNISQKETENKCVIPYCKDKLDKARKIFKINESDITAWKQPKINNKAKIQEIKVINNVLLTGVTGFLGSHILDNLLCTTNTTIYCIVRGKDKIEARERLLEKMRFYFSSKHDFDKLIDKKVFILNGDITLEKFGLTEKKYMELVENIDVIIHAAALVKHFGDYAELERANVSGTKEIVKFAFLFDKKLNHISTTSISGDGAKQQKAGLVLTEKDYYIGQNYYDNVYVKSKFIAENIVFKAINNGLNGAIYRMGNITGRYSDGMFQKNIRESAFYNIIKFLLEYRTVTDEMLEFETDLTPVDYCAQAIVRLSRTENTYGRVFHLYNENIVSIKDILNYFDMLGFKAEVLKNCSYNAYINNAIDKGYDQEVLMRAANYIDIRNFDSIHRVAVTSAQSIELLKKLDFEWPNVDFAYVSKILENMKKAQYLNTNSASTK